MAHRTHHRIHRRRPFRFLTEIVLASALLVLMLAFRFDLQTGQQMVYRADPPYDVYFLDDIPQTVQHVKPPPPPPLPQPIPPIPDEDSEIIVCVWDLEPPLPLSPPPPPPPDEDEPEPEPEILFVVEQMPELIGDLGEIRKKIKYPELARKASVEGRVIVQFIVDESGIVTEPTVLRSIGAGCDEEALRVVREAKFKPGKQRGKPVKVRMTLPIIFRL